jgi:UDPglucose 6-dehydrogenase
MSIKNISVVGVGRLGLCFALNLERCGYNVTGVEINPNYIAAINDKTFNSPEPHVNKLLNNCQNFKVYSDLAMGLMKSDVIFLVLPTPSLNSGKYDHQYIDGVVNQIISYGPQDTKKYLIISCTVNPGYSGQVQSKLEKYNYEVLYNPEFIAQGSIIEDQLKPDIILIGNNSEEGGEILKDIYKKLCINSPSVHTMSTLEAEIAKIALNCFITTKIAYANMVGDVIKQFGLDPDKVLNAIGSDSRIGKKCLKYGFGFGGPCFPRDNRAFGMFCEENGVYPHISYATDKSNSSHLIYQLKDFIKQNPNKDKKITVESVTYKPKTNILEESQKLKFVEELQRTGYSDITIKDDEKVIGELEKKYKNKFSYEKLI